MYEMLWGLPRVKPKWFKLLKEAKHGEIDHKLFLVQVTSKRVNATDGYQLVSLRRNPDWEIEPGLYILTSDRFLVKVVDAGEAKYPEFKSLLEYKDRTKTVKIQLGHNRPLSAMVYAIEEFKCFVSLDSFNKALVAIDELEPDFARVYGFDDAAKAKDENLIIEFTAESVEVLYVMLPVKETEKLLEVDEMPLFSTQGDT